MNIHEYQAKELLRGYGVAVLEGHVAWTPEEAEQAAAKLPGPIYVVKSQIHAGGRGAGKFEGDPAGKGGVRLAKSPGRGARGGRGDDRQRCWSPSRPARPAAGSAGSMWRRAATSSASCISRCWSTATPAASRSWLSTEGGMEIEHVAETQPEKILRAAIDPATGISGFHARKLAFGLGLEGKQVGAFSRFVDGDVQGVHRARLRDRRDQPAGRDRRAARWWRSMPR